MSDLIRRIGVSIVVGGVLLAGYTMMYRWGMGMFEGEQLSFVQAFQVVVEALTTAGFGGGAPWESAEMNLLIVAMNLTGVLLVFFAIPYFVVPLLKRATEADVPTTTDLSEHAVVCADARRDAALRTELEAAGIPALFIKSDPETTKRLVREGVDAIHGTPETAETLRNANLQSARAIIVDIDDETNADIILSARRLCPDAYIVSIIEDAEAESYHTYAGADEVIRPRVAVGEQLAKKAMAPALCTDLQGLLDTDDALEFAEVLIESGSELVGQTLAAVEFRERFGVSVVGGWFHGEFIAPIAPDRELTEHAVLLTTGRPDALSVLSRQSGDAHRADRTVIVGYGVVGRAVEETLTSNAIESVVVDLNPGDGVDIAADITDPETVEVAGIHECDSVVLSLDRDSRGVYATLVLQEHAPGVATLARADDVEYVQKFYDAGAAFVLSLSRVTAHMVITTLQANVDRSSTAGWEAARVRVPVLADRSIAEADIRARTGATIVAVERADRLLSNPEPELVLQAHDVLVVVGHRDSVASLESLDD